MTTSTRRIRTHAMWDAVADDWGRLAEHVDSRGAVVTEAMLEGARPGPGDDVLELACGAGGLGLQAATLVHPGGSVLLTDVSPRMVSVASARAADQPTPTPVRADVRDLDGIEDPNETYDVLLCREGLMFALDTDRACREMYRVLRPGGRLAVAVWASAARNPWLALVMEAAGDALGAPVPPPGIPGPLGLGDPNALSAHFSGAGFADVRVTEVPNDLVEPTFDSYFEHRVGLAGPLAVRLRAAPVDQVVRLREQVRAAVEPYRSAEGLRIPGLALVVTAARP